MQLNKVCRFILRSRREGVKYLFLLPSFGGILIFILIPFWDVIKRSFQTAMTGEYKGLANYRLVWENDAFRLASYNTFRFVIIAIPILLIISLTIALVLYQVGRTSCVKTLFLMPLAMPVATIVLVWKIVFSRQGLLNSMLGTHISFMSTDYAFIILIGSYLWKNIGYTLVLWLAGMYTIPREYTEAAKVDGAGSLQCLLYITVPNLKGTAYTIAMLSFLNSFKIYREAYLVAGAYPHSSMYLLQHLFNNWFANLDVDKMSAGAVMVAFVLTSCSLLLKFIWDRD